MKNSTLTLFVAYYYSYMGLLSTCFQKTTAASASSVVETVSDSEEWFTQRGWSLSGNRLAINPPNEISTLADNIYLPTTTEQVSSILKSTSGNIASICGGHEASNAALVAGPDSVVLDFVHMKKISISNDKEITVQSGVIFEELVEFVKLHKGAIPVGTGPTVGVMGYVINGGLSGYFSKRLGLLGQRVTKFTIVLADGTIKTDVTRDEDPNLFLAVLGAGSAMGVVTELSFVMADESVISSGAQFVAIFQEPQVGLAYSRSVLSYLRDSILIEDGDGVSVEMVYTSANAIVLTFVFYDTFQGNATQLVESAQQDAIDAGLVVVDESSWSTWGEVASALWPTISSIVGDPLALFQHSIATRTTQPSDATLDFISNTWIGEAPLVQHSIVEVRTLGGEVNRLPSIPTGNAFHPFFADTIVMFDAQNKSTAEINEIRQQFGNVLHKARAVEELSVDVSGTHSQGDDSKQIVTPEIIFGTPEFANLIQETKLQVDPSNRFRFHPFQQVLNPALVSSSNPTVSPPTTTSGSRLAAAPMLTYFFVAQL